MLSLKHALADQAIIQMHPAGYMLAQVPVIVDKNNGGKWVNDSFKIAKYLEATYPDRPTVFGGPSGDYTQVQPHVQTLCMACGMCAGGTCMEVWCIVLPAGVAGIAVLHAG